MQKPLSFKMLLAVAAAIALTVTAILTGFFDRRAALAAPVAISIDARQVFWNPEDPADRNAGALAYVGGLELSSQAAQFGGLSGLIVGETGDAFIAVTDQGNWFTANLISEGDRPTGVSEALIAPILGPDGAPFSGKQESDAEGITVPFGTDPRTTPLIVSFERHHRLRRFDLTSGGFEASAEEVNDFGSFEGFDNNKGVEAVAYAPNGDLIAISEESLDEDGHIRGSRLTETGAVPVRLRQHLPYMLTDMAFLPGGDLITLERHYSPLAGVGILMRRISAETLASGEPWDGEVLLEANNSRSIDNMEGLSIRRNAAGETLLYLISDDNFNAAQRTLLLTFKLNE